MQSFPYTKDNYQDETCLLNNKLLRRINTLLKSENGNTTLKHKYNGDWEYSSVVPKALGLIHSTEQKRKPNAVRKRETLMA
jgi:hypothetical protein